MALRERYVKEASSDGADGRVDGGQNYQEAKARLHQAIVAGLDLTKFNALAPDRVHAEVSRLAEGLLFAEKTPLSVAERNRLINEIHHELFGLGPLEPLLADETISDVLVNSYSDIYIERRGKLEKTAITFKDDEHLMRV